MSAPIRDPDELAALEYERDFLLRSLDDLPDPAQWDPTPEEEGELRERRSGPPSRLAETLAQAARITRSSMADNLSKDYIAAARSLGITTALVFAFLGGKSPFPAACGRSSGIGQIRSSMGITWVWA